MKKSMSHAAASTLGAVALAAGAVFLMPAAANASGLISSSCEYDPRDGLTWCKDTFHTIEQCHDAAEWTASRGAVPHSTLCVQYDGDPFVTLHSAWTDDRTPRV